MMILPEPTEVIPTRMPAHKPITAMPINDFMVGGRGGYLRLYELLDDGPDQVRLEMLWERFTARRAGRMCLRSELEQGR